MGAILAIVVPVFGLIALGYAARWSNILDDEAARGLSAFVFNLSLPALIVKTLTAGAFPNADPWGYWLAFFGGMAVAWIAGMTIATHLFGLDRLRSVVTGFASAQSNTVLVGVPLVLGALGEPAAIPLFLLVAVHLPITVSVGTVLVEGASTEPRRLFRQLATHPIILAILAGSALKLIGFVPSGPLKGMLDLLGAAANPAALVALGCSLRAFGLAAPLPLLLIMAGLKLVVHPLAVYLLATRVFTLPPGWVEVAVMFAACPTGVNTYLFAGRQQGGTDIAAGAIALSTALAVPTTFLWLWFITTT